MEKLAYPKMFRGADGRQKLQYIDLETGEPVTNLDGYRIVTGGGTDYYDPTPDGTDIDEDEQDLNPDPKAAVAQRQYSAEGGQKERQDAAGYSYATSQAAKSYKGANRGYINKPSWAKYANFLPGFAGTVAKGVNMAINANNVGAVNSARKAMGLDPVGIGGAIKGTLKDNQGNIARVQVGDGQYSVGFETLDKYGRTNMTPEEAMARANALGVDISEITGKAAKPADEQKGLLTRAKDAILGVEPTAPAQTPAAVNTVSKPASTTTQTQTDKPKGLQGVADVTASRTPARESLGTPDYEANPLSRPNTQPMAAYGPQRPDAPNADVLSAVQESVQNALGPDYSAVATSGIGKYGSARHPTGKAVDFGIVNNVTNERVTDMASLNAVAADLSYNNPSAAIGLGPGYMGGTGIHFDVTGIRAGTEATIPGAFGNLTPGEVWGAKNTWTNALPSTLDAVSFGKNMPLTPNYSYLAPTPRPVQPQDVAFREVVNSVLDGPLGTELGGSMLQASVDRNISALNPGYSPTVASRPEAPIGFSSMIAGRPDASTAPIGSLPGSFAMSPTMGVKDDNALGLSQSQIDAAFGRVDNPGLGVGLQAGVSNTNPAYGSPMASGIPDFTRNTVRPEGPVGPLPASRPAMSPTVGTKDDAVMSNSQYAMARDGAFHAISDLGRVGSKPADLVSTQRAVSSMREGISNAKDMDLSPTAHTSVFSGISPNSSVARSILADSVANDRFAGVDLSTASPAKMASLGLVTRTQEEKDAMARAIAGELGPQSLKALAANDPEAMREVANMVTSMENRLATERYNTVASMLNPSQYNSLMAEKLGITNQNYGLYGANIANVMNSFYNGTVQPDNFGITSYFNPDIADPDWGDEMTNPAITGQHVFGGLPGDYRPSNEFEAMRDSYAKAQISDTRGFTPSTGQLARSDPRATSYTPGIGKGASSSPGNAVSGASRSTAGKTGSIGTNGGNRGDIGYSSAGAGRGSSIGGPGIGSSAGAGPGRGSSPGGPSLGGSSSSSSSGYTGGGPTSGPSSSSSGGNNTSWGGTGEKL